MLLEEAVVDDESFEEAAFEVELFYEHISRLALHRILLEDDVDWEHACQPHLVYPVYSRDYRLVVVVVNELYHFGKHVQEDTLFFLLKGLYDILLILRKEEEAAALSTIIVLGALVGLEDL